GQAVVAFVTLKAGQKAGNDLVTALREQVSKEIGPIAKPDQIRFAEALPKTRSGKIMRRLLKEIAAGGTVKGDVTTLEDLNVIASLQSSSSEEG
ncbi:MAG: acetyl-coenzyme A synthetase, partial [Verrucomicrobia bacterium]|nr:acetyl-coenzyme A synthetase [Verrucomicrobiota bacterium]